MQCLFDPDWRGSAQLTPLSKYNPSTIITALHLTASQYECAVAYNGAADSGVPQLELQGACHELVAHVKQAVCIARVPAQERPHRH